MSEWRGGRSWAVLRNALTWGVAWAIAGGAIVGVLNLFSPNPAIDSLPERLGNAIMGAVAWGVRFGVIGAIVGTMFAAAIRFGYRGRRVSDISPVGFTLLGALVGGVGVPLFLQMMNVLTGGAPIAWNLVSDDAVICGVFGAAAAAGSILMARRGLSGGGGSTGEISACEAAALGGPGFETASGGDFDVGARELGNRPAAEAAARPESREGLVGREDRG